MTAIPMPEPNDAETEAKLRAIAEARASSAREGVITHADMVAWLKSWGTANERPPPVPTRPWK